MIPSATSLGPCQYGISVLDAANTQGFLVVDSTGQDASDLLAASGTSYQPLLDGTKSGQILLQALPNGGVPGLQSFQFLTAGDLSITLEIYGPQGFKYLWQEVIIFFIFCTMVN